MPVIRAFFLVILKSIRYTVKNYNVLAERLKVIIFWLREEVSVRSGC